MRKIGVVCLVAALSCSVMSTVQASAELEVGFSPSVNGQSALQVVLSGIDRSKQQILVAAYSFTSKPISVALIRAKQRGVDVRVVADYKANSAKYSAVTYLANGGVPVALNGRYAIMHNKFMVIDGHDVQTGSFNYTQAAAQKNAENALMLHDVPELAAAYTQDFERLWSEAEPLGKAY
jgi:phosphatidylserine/phosphatidylglycerophosphate/cardiolipin synthase-like enzyme